MSEPRGADSARRPGGAPRQMTAEKLLDELDLPVALCHSERSEESFPTSESLRSLVDYSDVQHH